MLNNIVWVITLIVAMTAFISYILVYSYRAMGNLRLKNYSIIILLYAMMASMLNGITYYLDMPVNFVNTVIAFNFSMVEMTLFVVYLLWVASTRRPIGRRREFSMGVAGLVIWNEISMGLTLISLAYPADIKDFTGYLSTFWIYFYSLGTNTFLFLIPMAVEMSVILLLFHRKDVFVYPLLSLVLMAILSPTFLGNRSFVITGVVLSAVIMTFFILLYVMLITKNSYGERSRDFRGVVRLIFYLYVALAIGEVVGLLLEYAARMSYPYSWAPYSLVMVVTMFIFFYVSFSGSAQIRKESGFSN